MEREEEGESKILAEPTTCPAPELEALAHRAGMSCQHLFVRSYLQAGQSDSFARAVFARYLTTNSSERVLPAIVKKYARRIKSNSNGHHIKRGFCGGCMLANGCLQGMAFTYSMVHPDSIKNDYQSNPEKVLENKLTEHLYDNLLASGALDREGAIEDEFPTQEWNET